MNNIGFVPVGYEYITIDKCGDREHIEIIRNLGTGIRDYTDVSIDIAELERLMRNGQKEKRKNAERKTE